VRRSGHKLGWTMGLFLALIGTIVGFNARATARQRDSALIINVAARQRALAERYIKDVLLKTEGFPADPDDDATQLQGAAQALLHGGRVQAVQGADETVLIHPIEGDWKIVVKLEQEQRLITELVQRGAALLSKSPASPDFDQSVLDLRVVGAQVSSITNDAVGEMTRSAQASLWHLVWLGIGLGLVGAVLAIGMALVIRRLGAHQAAQFRSLVHKASDLVTVLDQDGRVKYQSASAEQTLMTPGSEQVGSAFSALIHPDDQQGVTTEIETLLRHPSSVSRIEYRLRRADGTWRYVESAVTNLVSDPAVRGLVLSTRDITDRHLAEEKLRKLQAERAGLLDQTVQATELERKRVAAELHDGPVQHLTALDVYLETLRGRLEREDREGSAAIVDRLQAQLREEVGELRRMMSGLRPPMLDERGLPAALLEHLTAIEQEGGPRCLLEAESIGRLDPAQEVILYRVAQEAVTNSIKHAGARHVRVSLVEVDGHVTLEIHDDGCGFDPAGISESTRNGHFGLVGMRERVEMAGGTWNVRTRPGGGTLIRAVLPRMARAA
jgi:PAS domain S-box-containing protein